MQPFIDNQLIYDSHWHSWEEMKRMGPMSRHVRRLVFKQCRNLTFSSVLDIGCGPGLFLKEMKSRYPTVKLTGVDISETAIQIAKRHLTDADLFKMDVVVQVPDGRFDLLTMIDVAEHIEDDLAAFRNLRSICNKNLVVCTLQGHMRKFEKEVGHVRNYRAGELESKLERSGFKLERFLRWGWPAYSPIYRDLSGPIGAHRNHVTLPRLVLGYVAYWILMCNWPGRGDLIVAVARAA